MRFEGKNSIQAQALLAGLEGAMLSRESTKTSRSTCALAHQLLAQLGLDTLDLNTLDRRELALA